MYIVVLKLEVCLVTSPKQATAIRKDLRMYAITLYSLSPIQQGIQSLHAVVEYSLKSDTEYWDWATSHKTMVVLNGGTTISLKQIATDLDKIGVEVATFREEDLDDITTAIAFLVDVRNDTHVTRYLKSMRLA